MSEIAQEDFSVIQKSLSYGTATSIGMALAKLELLERQGCKVEEGERGTGMSEEISREEIAALLARGSEEIPREKAKVKTFDILRFIADNAGLSMFEAIEKAYYMGLSEQETKTRQYEKHIDHTDCIWYGNDSGCPVTCSQYRDGWNDAMDYIFKNGKGYQPYRHDS
jgi:hypothetical protein